MPAPHLVPAEPIPLAPDPVAFWIGGFPVHWYGLCYVVGLAATYLVLVREARRRGLDTGVVDRGLAVVTIAGLVGGRIYHVIDQWDRYSDDPLAIVLPPYAGLGVFGAIIAGALAMVVVMRLWGQSFWRWADVVAPAAFVMQAVARWGNFFNQELYGPPTDLAWGITIGCRYRVTQWPCTTYPEATTGFQPLFLYESLSGALGAVVLLWVARRWGSRMRPGDLFLAWVVWYSVVRFALETLRVDNWTVGGMPTAMIVSTVLAVGALAVFAWRHRPNADADRWGEPPADRGAEVDAAVGPPSGRPSA
ncbi:prolipoprotein diacylglyceryl transferase [Pseudonocardia humida]|uniref:Phosphatidylglycerol--prolipoprotein diacylglyceryl transferase n=1 Tax=Pseudonocardia humida TaxID=2800819 RepID=A0ABT1A3M6_9PSEU|nr:prolipoprotein diacylglyceryl transferase [Pseudonocardia humida]MCO1657409.1 prolipoprotein diacylglyceryl transferase [Pseudonocardia humida]